MKILTTIGVLFICLVSCKKSNAQIEVKKDYPRIIIGTVKAGGSMQAELYYNLIDSDTIYTLLYKNQEYHQISQYESVSFNGEGGTLEKLYTLLKSVFKDENKKNKEYRVNFKLGDSDVTVVNYQVMGNANAMFMARGHIILSEKQIDKLFGK